MDHGAVCWTLNFGPARSSPVQQGFTVLRRPTGSSFKPLSSRLVFDPSPSVDSERGTFAYQFYLPDSSRCSWPMSMSPSNSGRWRWAARRWWAWRQLRRFSNSKSSFSQGTSRQRLLRLCRELSLLPGDAGEQGFSGAGAAAWCFQRMFSISPRAVRLQCHSGSARPSPRRRAAARSEGRSGISTISSRVSGDSPRIPSCEQNSTQHLLDESFPTQPSTYSLRRSSIFQLPKPNTSYFQSSPIYIAAHIFNSLPAHLQTMTKESESKKKAKQHLYFPICPSLAHIISSSLAYCNSWSLCIYFFFNFTITLPYIAAHIIICNGWSPNDYRKRVALPILWVRCARWETEIDR